MTEFVIKGCLDMFPEALGKGHPIGATGASQIYWIIKQMRGEAAKGNQIDPFPDYGMTDTLGGGFGTLCHIILGRSKRKK
jgi:acetyl-CoA C-acetyltransferase